MRPEGIRNADHGLGRTQHHEAIRLGRLRKALEDAGLGLLIEIDQDVAAKDYIETSEVAEVLQQIELTMLHHGAYIGVELPHLSDLGEMLDQQLNREPALNLELAEKAGLGFFQNPVRQVGCHDFDPPARQRRAHLLEAHRDRIGLLPG